MEAIGEKLGLTGNRAKALRDFAGWLSALEAEELRRATKVFEKIEDGEWT